MAFWSSLRRKSEDSFDDYDEEYEDDYGYDNYNGYEDTRQSWESQGAQPIRSAADLQIELMIPEQYGDASKIADLLRDMKLVVLNLSKVEPDVSRRLLDFVSGVIYAEDGDLMKVSSTVYIAAPYFVDLLDETAKKVRSAIGF